MDLKRVKPYGDTPNDGATQLSFTLPVPAGDEAKEAARQLTAKMGFSEPRIAHMQSLSPDFTYFIVYGSCQATVDYTAIHVPRAEFPALTPQEVNASIQQTLGRKLKAIGACIESDAHTVGIDAIMNMKGYDGHKGLESYTEIEAINLGAQVSCEELLATVLEQGADALLISQVVTQRDIHIKNLTRLVDMLEAEQIREKIILIVGGPRISQELAKELGYDAGFGPGTFAGDVASYLVHELKQRNKGGT
ncbi:lysine 5,6-aminomutase subunit beta [Dethiobacter alkaliphilus]|uniref:Cobalamin B12-binding domain protein n=1 Tax=Dethiobacter alkaliphilus AHT 1 TaxID=555088 RepID=C0GEB8_DETAL|nr:OAM dimerization domain-containing protein [Dethiobacter alkaliphilus]EEG78412.1 cobalamin B12-binding domain protein [Dethiobacter alkaliphilus AHT 1]